MSDIVSIERRGDVAVISANNPPVNALSTAVRVGLLAAFEEVAGTGCKAVVLACAGQTFFAGADISEFGKPPADPWLPRVLARIEAMDMPVVAAIHGTALGGGLETAMSCHFRIAAPTAKLGLPEVSLGLLPGAGGTQWSPRLMGIEAALDLMLSGKPISARAALDKGLVDRVSEGDLEEAALAFAQDLIDSAAEPRRTSDLAVEAGHLPAGYFDGLRESVANRSKGVPAPQRIIDCVEAAANQDRDAAFALERRAFGELLKSPESAALRHLFFAARAAARIDDVPPHTPLRPVDSVAIIGAGTMGGGIAMCFANAGFAVTLLEIDQEALDRGLRVCRSNYERSAKKGRFSPERVERLMGRIKGTTSYEDIADADLVIEAVFEDPEVKYEVFRQLDRVCKPGAILASNTSYQDLDAIAAVTARPEDVVGLHFFSPANVMKLLEVVRGEKTADDVLITVMKLAKRIRKVPVLSRVCYGFIGNRMLTGYLREAQMLLLEGATPSQVDHALEQFGMAMGPLAVADLAGLDIGYKARRALPEAPDHPSNKVADRLVEMGRLGQKSGAGFYRYDPQTRQRLEDPEVEALIRSEAAVLGIESRAFNDQEIVERVIYPLINEGARVLDEGVAQRAGDIDVVYVYGYGFPPHRGGPMFYGASIGMDTVYRRICEFRDGRRPEDWQPADFLLNSNRGRT